MLAASQGAGAESSLDTASMCLCQKWGLQDLNLNQYYVQGSSWIVHITAIVIFVSFALYHEYQRRAIRKYHYQDPSKIILPILQSFLNLFIIVHALLAVFSGLVHLKDTSVCGSMESSLFIAVGSALYHLLYEGTAVFLCRYGIGWGALRASLLVGLVWAGVAFVVFLVLSDTICHAFTLPYVDRRLCLFA